MKGHTTDRERAARSQMRIQKDYIVNKGNNYDQHIKS